MGKAHHPVVTGRTLTLRIGVVVDNPGQLAIITIRRLLSPVVGPGRLVDHYLVVHGVPVGLALNERWVVILGWGIISQAVVLC